MQPATAHTQPPATAIPPAPRTPPRGTRPAPFPDNKRSTTLARPQLEHRQHAAHLDRPIPSIRARSSSPQILHIEVRVDPGRHRRAVSTFAAPCPATSGRASVACVCRVNRRISIRRSQLTNPRGEGPTPDRPASRSRTAARTGTCPAAGVARPGLSAPARRSAPAGAAPPPATARPGRAGWPCDSVRERTVATIPIAARATSSRASGTPLRALNS